MKKEEIQLGVDSIKGWYHTLTLPYGITTPGHDRDSEGRWKVLKTILPPLRDKSVLDVGAWDGFYSFKAEKEGAKVLATDHFSWNGSGVPPFGSKEGFDFAKLVFGSKIEELDIDVPDISVATVGRHDLVFFLNVLYHLENPYWCFSRIAPVAKRWIVIETIIDKRKGIEDTPYFRFVPNQILGDPTNWFIPNSIAIERLARKFGFEMTVKEELPVGQSYINENLSRMIYLARRIEYNGQRETSHRDEKRPWDT